MIDIEDCGQLFQDTRTLPRTTLLRLDVTPRNISPHCADCVSPYDTQQSRNQDHTSLLHTPSPYRYSVRDGSTGTLGETDAALALVACRLIVRGLEQIKRETTRAHTQTSQTPQPLGVFLAQKGRETETKAGCHTGTRRFAQEKFSVSASHSIQPPTRFLQYLLQPQYFGLVYSVESYYFQGHAACLRLRLLLPRYRYTYRVAVSVPTGYAPCLFPVSVRPHIHPHSISPSNDPWRPGFLLLR